jgi:hypothetical protein
MQSRAGGAKGRAFFNLGRLSHYQRLKTEG